MHDGNRPSLLGPTGKIAKVNATYNAAGTASDELLIVQNGNVGAQTLYEHDGLGRTTAEIFAVAGGEQWRTTYAYGGDRTHIDPPVGGAPTTTLMNAQGQTTEVRHYKGAAPVPAGPTSGLRHHQVRVHDDGQAPAAHRRREQCVVL